MADSVREQILQNIQTTLQGVTLENGYDIDLIHVSRDFRSPYEENAFPVARIWDIGEKKNQGADVGRTFSVLTVDIYCIDKHNIERGSRLSGHQASIEKAMLVDIQRGGLAYNTLPISNEYFVADETSPLCGVMLRFEIHYKHKIYDPYNRF